MDRIAFRGNGTLRFGGRSILGAAATGLLAAALLLLGISELPRQQREASRWVAHTLEVLGAAAKLEADLATMASEGRGFLIDKTADSRARFDAALLRADREVVALRALTVDNPAQQDALDRLAPLISARATVLRRIMQRVEAGDAEGALQDARTQRGRVLMDQVLSAIEGIKAEERRLLDERGETAQQAVRRTLAGLVACGVLVAVSGLFALVLLVGRERERKRLADLHQINAELEARIEARTADLAASEAQLRESEAGFRLLAEHASDMVSRVGPDGARRYVSPAAARILGVSPEALLGKGFLDLVLPEDRPALAASMRRLLAGEAQEEGATFRVRRSDGAERWVEAAARLLHDPSNGAPDGYIAVWRDITERHTAEAALRESEARHRLLADSTTDVITCLDLRFERTYASPACRAVFGYEPEEMLGAKPAATMHPDDADAVHEAVRPLVTGSADRATVTYRARHKQGHWVWVEATIGLVCDAATGHPASLVCSLRDISERHAQADELRAANAALERLARHLTRARDEAEQASRAKSRFLAGMSHELRTPLNGILGYTQLLHLEGGLNPVQIGRVDAMLGAGTHLLGMINRVLDLSEIEHERVDLQAAEVDLHDVAGACLDLVRPMAEAKTLGLILTLAPDTPRRVRTDSGRLRQVLLNLLGNAVKFTARGSIELRLQPLGETGLRIEVRDTGPGIPPERRQQLFQDFERLGADATGTVEGSGLGLALSAGLAKLLGGRLGHADNPGCGSVFWLELPVVAEATLTFDAPDAVMSSDVPTAEPAAAVPWRILVVDDVAMNRDIAGSFLCAAGHRVTYAEDGAGAAAAAATGDFDAVLMDVRMSGVDGLEATRRIRALAGVRGRVPIIALTAQAFAEQVAECRRAGMDGHLAKPFTQYALLEVLARAVVDGGARGVADAASADGPGSLVAESNATASASTLAAASVAVGSELPVVDPAAFERTAAFLSPEATASYLHTLIARGETLLRGLGDPGALEDGADDLAVAAHALAGSAGMFGFRRVAAVARRFEHAVQNASPETRGLANALATATRVTMAEMQRRAPAAGVVSTTDNDCLEPEAGGNRGRPRAA